jgi:hypothetical protein
MPALVMLAIGISGPLAGIGSPGPGEWLIILAIGVLVWLSALACRSRVVS